MLKHVTTLHAHMLTRVRTRAHSKMAEKDTNSNGGRRTHLSETQVEKAVGAIRFFVISFSSIWQEVCWAWQPESWEPVDRIGCSQ